MSETKRLPQVVRAIIIMIAFYLLSLVGYPLTHGKTKRLPELYLIASRWVLGAVGFHWMYQDWKWTERVILLNTLAGVATAYNRALLELREQNGNGH